MRRASPPLRLILPPLVLAAVFALLIGIRVATADHVLPNTTMAGLELGGDDAAGVRAKLEARAREPLTLVNGEKRWRISQEAAGLMVDVDSSVRRALDAGRDGVLFGFPATVGALVGGNDLDLDARYSSERIDRLVKAAASDVDIKPDAGRLEITDPDSIEVIAPKRGRLVERDVLRSRIRMALRRGAPRVQVPVATIPAASQEAVERVARDAREALSEPLDVRVAGRTENVSRERLATLLVLRSSDNARRVTLGTDTAKVRALVGEIAGKLDRPARNATVSAPRSPVIFDAKGEVTWRPKAVDGLTTKAGRDGRVVDRDAAAKKLAAAVRSGGLSVDLPTKSVSAAVTRKDAQAIDKLIGTFTTSFQAGQPRTKNIQTIARAVDGTVIAPGQTFSLNGIAGERTKDKGYVEAPFIAENKIVPSVGGGVSQASTTIYNAAYFAGLRIDAHRAHSLFIDRYPPGRESTLNFPDIDLKWTNDTEHPILVRAVTTDTSITVSLYGDNGNRRVTATPGARQPVPGGNFSITVTRTIEYADGREVKQPTTTRYENEVEGE